MNPKKSPLRVPLFWKRQSVVTFSVTKTSSTQKIVKYSVFRLRRTYPPKWRITLLKTPTQPGRSNAISTIERVCRKYRQNI